MSGRKIFEAVHLKNLDVKNRFICSATWESLSVNNGSITDEAYDICKELSAGEIVAIITSFTDISENYSYISGTMRLYRDDLIPQYKKLTGIIHQSGCPVIFQLANGVQIHAAHFFLSRFISPKANHRQDIYGGNTFRTLKNTS